MHHDQVTSNTVQQKPGCLQSGPFGGTSMHKTLVVHNRYAWRSYRTRAALDGSQGVVLLTIEQLAARLAGGFLQPIDSDDLKTAVASAVSQPLGELDAIKNLPGFQRAAAVSLAKAWSAGLSLEQEADSAVDPTAKARLASLAALEKEVLAQLPSNQLRPRDLVAAASERAEHARVIFGPIEIHGRTEMSPVWHPMISRIAEHTEVVWVAGARQVPEWLSSTGIPVETSTPTQPAVQTFSCASPRHEMLEALRWAGPKSRWPSGRKLGAGWEKSPARNPEIGFDFRFRGTSMMFPGQIEI